VTRLECSRERDVLDAVSSGRWPHQCGDELRDHVAACDVCADVAVAAEALQDARDHEWGEARVPPSGRVWWRAEMRARQEAAHKAAQPITIAQGLAGACAAGLVLAYIEIVWLRFSSLADLMTSLKEFISAGQLEIASLSASMPQLGWQLAVAIGAWILLVPIALYLVLSEE
jgi:hypothetical protein